jgi:hypothetical protein
MGADSSPPPKGGSALARAGRAMAIVTRAILAVSSLIVSSLGAFALAKVLHTEFGPTARTFWSAGVATAGGAVVLAALKDFVDILSSIIEIALKWSASKLARALGLTFVVSFGLALAILSLGPPPEAEGDSGGSLLLSILPPSGRSREGEEGIVFYVTFAEDATKNAVDNETGPGVDLSPAYRELLTDLGTGLSKCAQRSGHPVRASVVGMASSSPFAGLNDVESAPFNVRLANLRATKVKQMLETKPGIRVDAFEWSGYEEMVAARRFSDRLPNGKYDSDLGSFNRRVEVYIENLGDCEYRVPTFLRREGRG